MSGPAEGHSAPILLAERPSISTYEGGSYPASHRPSVFSARPEDVVVELSASDLSYSAGNAPKYVGNYLLGDQLGEGSYGKVKEALNIISHSAFSSGSAV
jgi:hypothetical protein